MPNVLPSDVSKMVCQAPAAQSTIFTELNGYLMVSWLLCDDDGLGGANFDTIFLNVEMFLLELNCVCCCCSCCWFSSELFTSLEFVEKVSEL